MDLDAGDLRVPVVITDNDTSGFTVEGTNLYTDTEFADGENYFRVYRRSSAVGNPFGFAGGWLVGRNYVDTGRFNRSVKQLWYFWNRHYEPEYLLRWLQPDPIGPWGDPIALGNPASYGAASPRQYVDLSGTTVTLPGPGELRDGGGHYVYPGADDDRARILHMLNFLLAGCGYAYADEVVDRMVQGSNFDCRSHTVGLPHK